MNNSGYFNKYLSKKTFKILYDHIYFLEFFYLKIIFVNKNFAKQKFQYFVFISKEKC